MMDVHTLKSQFRAALRAEEARTGVGLDATRALEELGESGEGFEGSSYDAHGQNPLLSLARRWIRLPSAAALVAHIVAHH